MKSALKSRFMGDFHRGGAEAGVTTADMRAVWPRDEWHPAAQQIPPCMHACIERLSTVTLATPSAWRAGHAEVVGARGKIGDVVGSSAPIDTTNGMSMVPANSGAPVRPRLGCKQHAKSQAPVRCHTNVVGASLSAGREREKSALFFAGSFRDPQTYDPSREISISLERRSERKIAREGGARTNKACGVHAAQTV